jgi:hypothetical protein
MANMSHPFSTRALAGLPAHDTPKGCREKESMPSTPRASSPPRRNEAARKEGLFPCEAEIARRLSQTLLDWKAKATVLEREGLPRVDPLMGGRYWPAVFAWWNRRYGLSTLEVSQPDGEENLNAL